MYVPYVLTAQRVRQGKVMKNNCDTNKINIFYFES